MSVAQNNELSLPSRRPVARCAFALTLLVAACGSDETERALETDAGRLDASSALDALDARRPVDDATVAVCYSPLQAPAPGLASVTVSRLSGCACPVSSNTSGYCINGYAVRCYSDGWGFGSDGNCFAPREPYAVGSCARRGGALQTSDAGCPGGFDTLARYSGDAGYGESAPCCLPIEVSAQSCSGAGLLVSPASVPANKLETVCPGDAGVRAFVLGEPLPSVCCSR